MQVRFLHPVQVQRGSVCFFIPAAHFAQRGFGKKFKVSLKYHHHYENINYQNSTEQKATWITW